MYAWVVRDVDVDASAVIPEPSNSTVLMFGTGLAGLEGIRFRKRIALPQKRKMKFLLRNG